MARGSNLANVAHSHQDKPLKSSGFFILQERNGIYVFEGY